MAKQQAKITPTSYKIEKLIFIILLTVVCLVLYTKTAPNEMATHAISIPDVETRSFNTNEHPFANALSPEHVSIPSAQHDCGNPGGVGQSLEEFNPQHSN